MLAGLHHVGMQSPRPESNRRPPDSKSGVPRQRRLRGSASPQLSLRGCWLPTSVRSARTEPVRPCIGRTETKQPRAWHPALASRCVLSEYWAQAGGNPVFPRPLTGSPYGGRVMRVRVSGRRRIASNSRIRSRRGSGGLRPGSSHADLVGTRRTRDPRLSENEHAAG